MRACIAEGRTLMPKKILVVDDDDSMLSLYERVFAGTDYAVSMATTMKAALDRMDEIDFDLLVTDFMFPDGVGTDLIRSFEEKKPGGAKSMLVSGSTTEPPPGKFPSLVGYFEKPFRVKTFLEAVAKALA